MRVYWATEARAQWSYGKSKLKKLDFSKGSGARKIAIEPDAALAGEVSAKFAPAGPFKWIK